MDKNKIYWPRVSHAEDLKLGLWEIPPYAEHVRWASGWDYEYPDGLQTVNMPFNQDIASTFLQTNGMLDQAPLWPAEAVLPGTFYFYESGGWGDTGQGSVTSSSEMVTVKEFEWAPIPITCRAMTFAMTIVDRSIEPYMVYSMMKRRRIVVEYKGIG